jgi:hypothetical protein
MEPAMDDVERGRLLDRIASVIGDDAFNRLVGSVKDVRRDQRLRFWQEALLGQAAAPVASVSEFLDLFGEAKWRPTGRSKDPLTAATTSILKPVLTPLGFQELGSRCFARVRDSVLQYLALQLSMWGSRDFAVNYAAITLYSPREEFVGSPGGRLPRGKSSDGWWASKNHEFADNSMRDVVARLNTHCLPWFERTGTTAGLLEVLLEENARLGRSSITFLFDIACCQVHLGQFHEGQCALEQAAAAYRKSYQDSPDCTWDLARAVRCERLLVAIQESQQAQLLAQWRAESVRNLKLEKIA